MANTIKAKLSGAAFALSILAGSAAAAELTAPASVKPIQGLSFEIGSKQAVTYFEPVVGICNLTLVLADRPNDDGSVRATASRVSVAVMPGRTARIDTAEGKALEFACKVGATEMTVKAVEQVAWTPKAPKG